MPALPPGPDAQEAKLPLVGFFSVRSAAEATEEVTMPQARARLIIRPTALQILADSCSLSEVFGLGIVAAASGAWKALHVSFGSQQRTRHPSFTAPQQMVGANPSENSGFRFQLYLLKKSRAARTSGVSEPPFTPPNALATLWQACSNFPWCAHS